MPYIGKPQSSDPITVNTSNIEDGSIIPADISSSLGNTISGSLGSNAAIIRSLDRTTISGSIPQALSTTSSPTFNNITATGTLTAQEIHTEFTSASILFTSGSTIFGNSSDDVHNMTGSLNVSGSLFVKDGTLTVTDNVDFNGDLDVDGTTNLDVVDIDGAVDMASKLVVTGQITGSSTTLLGGDVNVTADGARFFVSSADYELVSIGRAGSSGASLDQGYFRMKSAGSNKIALHTAGDSYFNGGNLGIGTASPTALFEVKTDDENIARFDGLQGNIDFRYGSDIEFDRAGQVYITANNGSGELNFRTGGQNIAMHIDSSQNVGIGTTGPGATLHVDDNSSTAYNGAAEIAETVIFRNKNGSDGSGVNNVVSIGLQVADGATSQGFINYVRTGDNTGKFTFSQRTAGSTYAEHMRIDSSGVLTTTSGSAVSTFTNQQKYYVSSPDAEYLIANSPEEYSVADSNANYKRMKTFIASRSGRIRVKWEGYISSGTYWWSWRFSKNNGSSTDAEPTAMKHPNGDNADARYADGLASGVSNSVHAYREFDVALDGVVAGDQIELWMRSANNSGGQVTGNGQTLYAKNFEVYSDVPNAPKHLAHQFGFTLEDGNALFGTRTPTTTNVGGATFAPNSVGRTILNLGSVNYTSEIDVVRLFNQNGEVGDIRTNGSGASFNSASDYRLKENQVTLSNALTRLNNLKPYRFNFKADSDTTLDGFFAHEVQEVVPEAVSGTKDQMKPIQYQPGDDIPEGKQVYDVKEYSTTEIDPQKLDASKLVPLLVAALQEADDKIVALTTRIEVLEG